MFSPSKKALKIFDALENDKLVDEIKIDGYDDSSEVLIALQNSFFGEYIIFLFTRSYIHVINSKTGAILASHKASYARIVPVGNYIYSIVNESLIAEAGVYIESLSSIFSR